MDELIRILEGQLADVIQSSVRPTTNEQRLPSREILAAIHEYQRNIQQYQENMELLLRLLQRNVQHNRTRTSSPPSRVFTFFANTEATPTEPRLTEEQIRNETANIVYDASLAQHTVCPISLEDFVQGEAITQIRGCGHAFKDAYLRRWLERKTYCPVCRYNLLDHSYNSMEQSSRPPLTEDYDVVGSADTEENETHITLEIPFLYDTSTNQVIRPQNGQRTTRRQMNSYIMRELMRGLH